MPYPETLVERADDRIRQHIRNVREALRRQRRRYSQHAPDWHTQEKLQHDSVLLLGGPGTALTRWSGGTGPAHLPADAHPYVQDVLLDTTAIDDLVGSRQHEALGQGIEDLAA